MTMNLDKFIGEFQIPVYNKLTHYNYYDVFDALVKLVFTEDHIKNYEKREEELNQALMQGEALNPFDTINEGSKEYDRLSVADQERWLEVNDQNFQPVINRMEHKGLTPENAIVKLTNMR